ncbi:hypothetical protein E1265_15305 [Streptomyces sp. 8K308]|uniref:TadE family type IV pilus minor pilin n=1 Tax=Streptomyces sp. 8K308 TaxID=2530388 RepID=UPI0010477207|nr:TadE family type IV pilus minor pilin [Streptomyces sp. 8K308]TDC22577.1 hypothetical protein E1265_15305 [Streptomyces sp. 8K308]
MRRCERGDRCDKGDRGDRGFVTAESALAVPALLLLLGMLLWGLGAVALQLRCGDAARAGARAVARGEPAAEVTAVARAAAPGGAEVRIERDGGLHRVVVTVGAPGPGPLALPVSGEAVARAEPD